MIWYIIKMYQAKNPKLLRKCSVILCSIGLTVVHGHLLQRQITLFYNILIKSWFKGDFKFPWRDHEPIRTIYYSLNWNGSEHFSARWTIFRLIRKWTLKMTNTKLWILRFPYIVASMDSIWLHLPFNCVLESTPIRHKKRSPSHILELLESFIRDQ